MKIIGEITPEWGEDGQTSNGLYLGGSIVMLSQAEMKILEMLQDAIDGEPKRWMNLDNIRPSIDANIVLDDAFSLVRVYTESRFAVNELKIYVEQLEKLLKDEINE